MIEIVATGALATLQDAGRAGWTSLGVPRSGAFDLPSLRTANRLVGNDPDACGVEITLGGLHLRTDRAVSVALTGAPCDGAAFGVALSLAAGASVRLGPPATGVRSYLAVRGGFLAGDVLGSAATDTLSGLGAAVLSAGDRLDVGGAHGEISAAFAPPPVPGALPVVLGPRQDWFASPDALFDTVWRVRSECDRVGVRLDGPPLRRARDGELPSEPVLPGAIQVPGDGRPIVFGPDAPVTGGYPVIGVVTDLAAAAQLQPGDEVRFTRSRHPDLLSARPSRTGHSENNSR